MPSSPSLRRSGCGECMRLPFCITLTPVRLSTGMRAVDHAVENLYRPGVPPPLKFMCLSALSELARLLPASKAAPEDLAARQALQLAAWMSLWPLKMEKYAALGLSHALGHKLGARYGIPHGITSVCEMCATRR
jgi:alcohol dehydrogenase class IV